VMAMVTQTQSEKRVQAHVVKNLKKLGYFVSSFSQAQKAQMTAGVPDLFVAHSRWGALWIEMKIPERRGHKNGGLNDAQLIWHVLARQSGIDVITAYGWVDVERELRKRGVPIPV
jgi:hypothetical protein